MNKQYMLVCKVLNSKLKRTVLVSSDKNKIGLLASQMNQIMQNQIRYADDFASKMADRISKAPTNLCFALPLQDWDATITELQILGDVDAAKFKTYFPDIEYQVKEVNSI